MIETVRRECCGFAFRIRARNIDSKPHRRLNTARSDSLYFGARDLNSSITPGDPDYLTDDPIIRETNDLPSVYERQQYDDVGTDRRETISNPVVKTTC